MNHISGFDNSADLREQRPKEPAGWGRLDLNLLIPLNALLLEQNVTKAAERLSMAQPTMSTMLAKLRRHFNDPLLIRDGRTLVLTPFAESLLQPVQTAMVAAREVLASGRKPFDPITAERTFTMIACDYTAGTLLLPTLRGLTAQAPGARVNVEPLRAQPVEQLRSGRCDLLFWPLQLQTPGLLNFPHLALFTDEFIAVADQENHAVNSPLTAEALASAPAVQINGPRVVSEVKLSEQGIRQPIAVTVESYMVALRAITGSSLITLTPRRLFDQLGPMLGLREIPLAIEQPRLTMAMFWHPRNMRAPAHQWIRDRLESVAAQL
ncbi:DNA-binding transcriptional LysR family regulator [Kibdelosporangium banguiense]|uniref:DNA-binding transcriptional LysR family regulator n=1 Tax=Kibdelosporangium banguiense TaxID=1365924 RepID=A0ABS4TVX6_9PSEU|nr:LysR family transcriptional regulator [Kibdelosporangium banguiense]MBP2328115.1 DNA-binding transcriptional LysR family regulator [Kibdelosporangium banguiense]